MNKIVVGIFTLALLLTACAPPTPAANEQPSIIIEQPPQGSNEMTPAQIAALTELSKILNLPADQITLISTETVTWPDGCLGVQKAGVMCTQANVEGFRIIFEAKGGKYELHTDAMGKIVMLANNLNVDNMAETAVINQLSNNLRLVANAITVVSSETVAFSDTCMGVAMQDVTCVEANMLGRIIVLEANGIQYEYHVSGDGSRIQPATFALTWRREGGIAGFCDSLTVFLSGEVYGNQCKSQPNGTMGTFATLLSTDERDRFNAWIEEYGSVTLDASDPKGVADGMTNEIVLFGNGKGKPNQPIEGDIFSWTQDLFRKLYE